MRRAAVRDATRGCLTPALSCLPPAAVMPHGALVDYEPAVVVTVPPGASLLSVFKAAGRYVAPGQGLQELEQEGPEARLQRWDHLPLEVMARQPPWLV